MKPSRLLSKRIVIVGMLTWLTALALAGPVDAAAIFGGDAGGGRGARGAGPEEASRDRDTRGRDSRQALWHEWLRWLLDALDLPQPGTFPGDTLKDGGDPPPPPPPPPPPLECPGDPETCRGGSMDPDG